MQRHCRARPAAGKQTVSHRAHVHQVGHAHRQHLAQLPAKGVWPPEMQLGKTAGCAGDPGKEGSSWEVDLAGNDIVSTAVHIIINIKMDAHLSQHPLHPGAVGAVHAQSQSTAVLVGGHAHIVQQEERVMRLLRM